MFKSNLPKRPFGSSPVWVPTGEVQSFNPFGAMALCSLGYIPGAKSLIKGIEVPEREDPPVCDKEYTERELIELMKQVIREQDFGDNPILISLSGGLDSRLVSALLVDVLGPDRLVAFTWGIPNCRDIVIAREVVKNLGIKQHIVMEIDGSYVTDYASYFMEIVKGESAVFAVAPFFAHNKTIREMGIEYIADGYFGEYMNGATRRMPIPPIIVTDKNSCFKENYTKEHNRKAREIIVAVQDADRAITNLWLKTFDYRSVWLYQMPIEKEGYKIFSLLGIPKIFAAIDSIPKRKRTRKWMAGILQQIKSSLCEIPYQQTGKAFIGDRQVDPELPKTFFDEQLWLRNYQDWAMELYSNAEAFEAFGMKSEKVKGFAEEYFGIKSIPDSFPPYWLALKYSLSLSVFYNLAKESILPVKAGESK